MRDLKFTLALTAIILSSILLFLLFALLLSLSLEHP